MADIDAPLSWRMQQDGYLMQIDQLKAENAKLRELVMHLYKYRQWYFRTGIYGDDHGVTERRMRELGIEVEL